MTCVYVPLYSIPLDAVTCVTDVLEIMVIGKQHKHKHERAAVMSLQTVRLFIATRHYEPTADGDAFPIDSSDRVIECDWEEFQSRGEFIEEIAGEFRKLGASFEFTGARWAQTEPYQHPYTGVWEEASVSFLDGADDALQVAVIREVDKR